jgi:hypothetical protein
MVCLAQTVHLSWVKISSISKRSETSFHSSLVTEEYHRVHLEWFLTLWYAWRKPCNYLAPTQTPSQNRPKQDSTWPTSPGVPLGASKMICKPMLRSAQTVHLSCVKISTFSKRTETSFHLSLITLEYHQLATITIYDPMVRLVQSVHLSCTDTNTVSKWTKTRFDMNHVT